MKAAENHVVSFHYTVSEVGGSGPVESSREREPLVVLLGHGSLIPGMENALMGRAAGERFEVTVEPSDAYGEHDPEATQRVPKKYFRDHGARLAPGEVVVLQTSHGPRPVTVRKVGETVVDVDTNHPMAGKTLHFDIEVLEVRAASDEEIAHGHAHGPGGHQH